MAALITTLQVQLACQLIHGGQYSYENLTLALDPKEPQVLPDGFTPFPDIGMAYRYFNQMMTWNAARQFCIAHESNLAVIDSFRKVNYVFNLKNNPHDHQGAHIGIHRLFGGDDWVSIRTGLPVGGIPWIPDGIQRTKVKNNNCLEAWDDGTGVGALLCDDLKHVVCEIPLA